MPRGVWALLIWIILRFSMCGDGFSDYSSLDLMGHPQPNKPRRINSYSPDNKKQTNHFLLISYSILSRETKTGNSHAFTAQTATYSSPQQDSTTWLMDSSMVVVKKGDVTRLWCSLCIYSTLTDTLRAWDGAQVSSAWVSFSLKQEKGVSAAKASAPCKSKHIRQYVNVQS